VTAAVVPFGEIGAAIFVLCEPELLLLLLEPLAAELLAATTCWTNGSLEAKWLKE